LTLELLAGLMRTQRPVRNTTPPRWLRDVENYIRAHFAQPVHLDAIAAEVHLHPAHLSRSFRRFRGCTVGEYVRRMRVDHAVGLLANTDLPLPAVAVQAGFYDQADMTRSVRRWTGRTPGQHRGAAAGR
jgi:AraC family transcriptional regulator